MWDVWENKYLMAIWSVHVVDGPLPGLTLSEVMLAMSSQILSKLTVNLPPPRINIFICNACYVFVDPFQVDHQLTHPGSTLSDLMLAMSLQILSKLTIRSTPQDQHCPPHLPSLSTYNFPELNVDRPPIQNSTFEFLI